MTSDGVKHPQGADYGILGWIVGTVLSTAIAAVIAVPVSVFAALVIVFKLPRRLSTGIGFVLELLAGIPSVVIGLWGALTLGPFLAAHVYPAISAVVGGTPGRQGLLTSGLVLAMMIVPIVAATTRDLFRTVPSLQRDGATALGLTDWEVARAVTLPWVSSGIVGAAVLGIARALGETMAVAMVSGVILSGSPSSLFAPITTIAATIATQLDSALTDSSGFAVRSLAETAPLLYTAGFTSSLPSLQLTHAPVASLTYAVWTFYNQPSPQAVDLSYDAPVILVVLLLVILVVSRLVVGRSQRYSETGGR